VHPSAQHLDLGFGLLMLLLLLLLPLLLLVLLSVFGAII
jgi:hypothetical protein